MKSINGESMVENKEIEEINERADVDNSRLEELLQEFKDNPSDMTGMALEEELKKSQLYLPVIYPDSFAEKIMASKEGDTVSFKEGVGFDINYLKGRNGEKVITLFTSDEIMKEIDLKSSVLVMYVEDLVNMLQGAGEKYQIVTINPFTETGIDMPISTFLNMFKESEITEEEKRLMDSLKRMLEILEEYSMELKEKVAFYSRSPDDFMKEGAVDGVFVPNMPFSVSTEENMPEEDPYLNILLFDEGKKMVYIGEAKKENPFNVLIAPQTEFELIEEVDDFTRIWKCGAQPFYDK